MDTDGDYSLANLLVFASAVYASPKISQVRLCVSEFILFIRMLARLPWL